MKSSDLVSSLSVEGSNHDTKVLYIPEIQRKLEVQSVVPKFYVLRSLPLMCHGQSCLMKLTEPILIRPIQQLHATKPNDVPWNYNKIIVLYQEKQIVEKADKARGLTRSGRCYSPEELRKGKMVPKK